MKENKPTSNAANLRGRASCAILLACMVSVLFATTACAEESSSNHPESTPKLSGIVYPAATIDAKSPLSPPRYPREWANAGITGMVVLLIYVNPDDSFNVIIEKSSRHRELDESAMEAARSWRFRAAKVDGKAVYSALRVPFNFSP